ncbi:MAG: hypothetical protein HYT83_03495 [Candidatus Levybacteria bacterium]|nr:hypothetical protein [Candidatus Levybacteria bacterium]
MERDVKESILKTLVYADLFDYPLTLDEIWRFLISNKIVSKKSVKQCLASHLLSGSTIVFKNGFYFLFGRKRILDIRKRREKESIDKFIIAQKIIKLFSYIPWVYFIGVSGSLAMRNANKEDDIDFFIVTEKNRLWITRFFLFLLLEIYGLRRKRNEKKAINKICLNMLIDEKSFLITKENQDLFSAHEIIQLVPLFDRNNTYERFINANLWFSSFLPNALKKRGTKRNNMQNYAEPIFSMFLAVFELFAKKTQLWYMKKHRTNEIVSDGILAFYPSDFKNKVLKRYNKLLKQYGKI